MKLYILMFFVYAASCWAHEPASLRIGLSAEMNTLDPHRHVFGVNLAFSRHVFDPLILQDEHQKILPGLAQSWTQESPTVWILKLRRDVTFHDGRSFTASDAVASIKRAQTLQKGLSAFASYYKPIKSAIVVDPYTLKITTHTPYASTLSDLCLLAILPKEIAEKGDDQPLTEKDMIGTGPYLFSAWKRGESLTLTKNLSYWGKVEPWDRVTFYMLPRDRPRTAALLSGHVDLIDAAPLQDLQILEQKMVLHRDMPTRFFYLALDLGRDETPYIKGGQGNPLKSKEFRHHLSAAIDRLKLTQSVLHGTGTPAYQFIPKGMPGYFEPRLPPSAVGQLFPPGLTLTLHGPQGRYPADQKVMESIAHMLSQKGLPTEAKAQVSTLYFPQLAKRAYSITLHSWPVNREVSPFYKVALHTHNPDAGYGTLNRTGYSNPLVDQLIKSSMETMVDKPRFKLLETINQIAVDDMPMIPLYFMTNVWASRKGLSYKPRMDELTLAMGAR